MDLTKDAILSASDLNLLKVHVKEWGGDVYISVMSAGDRDAYECEWLANKERGVQNFRSKFLARCLCDKDGRRLFTDAEIDQLASKSIAVVDRLFAKATKHNAVSMEDVNQLAGE